MTDASIWDQEIDVPEEVISYVDEAVAAKLPEGSIVKNIRPYGASYWTRTAEIETRQPDGADLSFFLKVSTALIWQISGLSHALRCLSMTKERACYPENMRQCRHCMKLLRI